MMRGDKKWPPEQKRQEMIEEEEELKKIAQGPAIRPTKVNKVRTERMLMLKEMKYFSKKATLRRIFLQNFLLCWKMFELQIYEILKVTLKCFVKNRLII